MAILLFACSLCQCLVRPGIVAWYECNKAYIAAHLCENRYRPQLKCCGKCYLRKQLKKADKGEEPGKPGSPGKYAWTAHSPFLVPGLTVLTGRLLLADEAVSAGYYRPMALQQVWGAVFHPPQAVCTSCAA